MIIWLNNWCRNSLFITANMFCRASNKFNIRSVHFSIRGIASFFALSFCPFYYRFVFVESTFLIRCFRSNILSAHSFFLFFLNIDDWKFHRTCLARLINLTMRALKFNRIFRCCKLNERLNGESIWIPCLTHFIHFINFYTTFFFEAFSSFVPTKLETWRA